MNHSAGFHSTIGAHGNMFNNYGTYHFRWNGKKPEQFDEDLWSAIDDVLVKHGLDGVMERD